MKKNDLKTLIIVAVIFIIGLIIYLIFFHNDRITSFNINKDNINILVNESEKLSVEILPEKFSNQDLIWESNNNTVASVSSDGTVTGNSVGSVVINVRTEDGQYHDMCLVKVMDSINEIIEIEEKEITLNVGVSSQINIIVNSSESSNQLTWSSSNTSVITVDQNGIVTAQAPGEAVVKVSGLNAEAECLVKVVEEIKYNVTFNANGGSVNLANKQVAKNEVVGELPTPIRSDYNFLGWFTSEVGGIQITSGQVITSDTIFSAHWERIVKVMTETFKVPSGYSEIGKYNSSTLKYRKIKKNGSNVFNYYTLIWVKDAYNQLNSANNNYNAEDRIVLLDNEIKKYNYQKKGMIAVNGSFTISGRSNTPIIMTKGQMKTNDKYNSKYVYLTLTLGSDNWLKAERFTKSSDAMSWLSNVGARNTWAITTFETSNWSSGTDGGSDFRTSICQIDENNFVLYVGNSNGIHAYMKELHDLFGCKIAVNLDGGGSSGMYYKTNKMSSIGEVYEYPRDRGRKLADMLYFVEQ